MTQKSLKNGQRHEISPNRFSTVTLSSELMEPNQFERRTTRWKWYIKPDMNMSVFSDLYQMTNKNIVLSSIEVFVKLPPSSSSGRLRRPANISSQGVAKGQESR